MRRADDLQRWIREHAVTLTSTAPTDDELTFLTDVVGDASIVLLGEASHSVGNGFALRGRIVEFLHAHLGFDVVIWELSPGLLGTRSIAGAPDRIDQIATIKREGFWGSASELDPLFSYAIASRAGARPLEMIGYDIVSTPEAITRLASGLRSFFDAVPDQIQRDRLRSIADTAFEAYHRIPDSGADVPQRDIDDVVDSATTVLEAISEHREQLEDAYGPDEVSFAEVAVESLKADGVRRAYAARAGTDPTSFWRSWAERDIQGARNLRWLIETGFAGRKVVIWAHNLHVANASVAPGFGLVRPGRHDDLMIPIGVEVHERWPERKYAIVVSHYDGEENGIFGTEQATPLPLPPSDSLDARLHALDAPAAFVDLRLIDGDPDHPLRQPQSLRLITHGFSDGRYDIDDVTAVADGILHIDRAIPSARTSLDRDAR